MLKPSVIDKFRCKKGIIGVVGLGYVGLPLALRFSEVGFHVLGFDIDSEKVAKLNQGENYIHHLGSERVAQAQKSGLFSATTDFSKAIEADALILCVPTPLNKNQEPDLSYIRKTVETLTPYFRRGQLISLESTTYPGTTDEEIRTRLEERGFRVGEDIFLVFSPEREDPGNQSFNTQTIPKIIGGTTANCLEVGISAYEFAINKLVPVSSTQAAELAKLLENIYRAINISLVNELKIIADRMKIDIWEVIDAAATKPFGFTPFYPGPGMGGHCIPIDPFYLTWKAREFGIHTRFIELAGEINTAMPEWVVAKVTDALNDVGRAVRGSKILVLGLAYKKNIDDVRESPAVELLHLLSGKGAEIAYSDPHVPVFPKMRNYQMDLQSIKLSPEVLRQMDGVLIATDHDQFDYDLIQRESKLIFDTRGRYRKNYPNVVRC